MLSLRRLYVLLTAAFAAQAALWNAIALTRGLLDPEADLVPSAVAFQVAVLVVTVPIFVLHWRWAGRLAGRAPEERAADARRFYLFAMAASFVVPMLSNAHDLVAALLRPVGGDAEPIAGDVVRAAVALVILGVVAWFNGRVIQDERAAVGEPGRAAAFRRLYTLGLAAVGLTMAINGAIGLLRVAIAGAGDVGAAVILGRRQTAELAASALVGVVAWAWFWRAAQARFASGAADEERSTLRKIYLYAVVLVTVLAVVFQSTTLVAGLLRSLLGLPSLGDFRDPLAVIVVNALAWALHRRVLLADAAAADEAPRQAAIRRLYDYLVAAVGMGAGLAGLGGVVHVLIGLLGRAAIGDAQREMLAWSAAGLLSGLVVWTLPWRRAQAEALADGDRAEAARDALPRKAYLYFYLLVAAVAFIVGCVYVVFRIVGVALGEPDPQNDLGLDLARAVAVVAIAAATWAYHLRILRADGDLDATARRRRLAALTVVVADGGDGAFGAAVLTALARSLDGLKLVAAPQGEPARAAMGAAAHAAGLEEPPDGGLEALRGADAIVAPWSLAAANAPDAALAAAIGASPARKLVMPTATPGWDWVGLDPRPADEWVEQAVAAVEQVAAGERVRPRRPLGAAATVLLGIGLVLLVTAIGIPVFALVDSLF